MPHFCDTVRCPAPREDAFDYLANFASVAEWDPSVTEARELPMTFGFRRLARSAKAGLERELRALGSNVV